MALKDLKKLLLGSLRKHPQDLVTFVAKKASVTRPAVHKHLVALIREGLIQNTSNKKTRPHYISAHRELPKTISSTTKETPDLPRFIDFEKKFLIQMTAGIFEDEIWRKYLAEHLKDLATNVKQICLYGFTEMFNNVIDHSEASQAAIILRKGLEIEICIMDNGVGIFKKIQKFQNLPDPREAILHLSKGKFTTDPSRHTGQGIFFTSRAFDQFSITSSHLSFVRLGEEDWFLEETSAKDTGTFVSMKIKQTSEKKGV